MVIIKGVDSPVFDLYGENDLPHVVNTAQQRKTSINKNKLSKQMIIPDANHFFNEKEEEMINTVKVFLDNVNNEEDQIRTSSIVSLLDTPAVTCEFGW